MVTLGMMMMVLVMMQRGNVEGVVVPYVFLCVSRTTASHTLHISTPCTSPHPAHSHTLHIPCTQVALSSTAFST